MLMKNSRIIHVSELNTYNACPRLYQFAYIAKILPKRVSQKLSLGTGIHLALAMYYRKRSAELALNAFKLWYANSEHDIEDDKDIRELGLVMLENYFQWAAEHDDFEVVAVEQQFSVPVWTSAKRRMAKTLYEGTWDGVVRRKEQLWLHELKTAKSFPSEITLRLDTQTGLYLVAANQIYKDPVVGVMYTVIRKVQPNKARTPVIERYYILKNPNELNALCDRMYHGLLRIRSDKHFAPTPGLHCSWRCPYSVLCTAIEEGIDVSEIEKEFFIPAENATKTPWHEKIEQYLKEEN